jgi:hypothetical protein
LVFTKNPILFYTGSFVVKIQKKDKTDKKPVTPLEKKLAKYIRYRWACRAVVAAATATSIWANRLQSDNNAAAIVIHVMPPIIVLVGFEMSSHIPAWKNAKFYNPRRWARPGAMLGITVIGAWISYWNQQAAFWLYGHDLHTSYLLPLAIDGLMIIASVAVLDLNNWVEEYQSWIEAGAISTNYKPKEPAVELVKAPKPEREPNKKERIIALLKKEPALSVAEIAARTGADAGYIYTIKKQLLAQSALPTAPAATVV